MKKESRRSILKRMAAGSSLMLGATLPLSAENQAGPLNLKGRINHSVCRWTYNSLTLDQLCQAVKDIGFSAIDLIPPSGWPTLKKYGIHCSMCNGEEINIPDGWNEPKNHEKLIKEYAALIPQVAEGGYKNLICFSGNRRGMDDVTGMKNCITGLKNIMPLAEKHGVMIIMELLNSKVDHKDYMCDKSGWGVELCKQLGSPNFKLLYDIYHMQIDEGDIIRTIKANYQYFGHYHTGGNPGRHEIDDTQEIYYPAVMRAIVETGYKGHVAQEFIPVREDKLASLRQAVALCDV